MIFNKSIYLGIASAAMLSMAACQDFDDLNRDPYAIEDDKTNESQTKVDDDTKYADINIDYKLDTPEDSAKCAADIPNTGATFRNFLYEGYYAQHQRTTNLTHDIYAGFVANNQPKHAKQSPDYSYTDGWSALRWSEFFNSRSAEYRTLLRAYKFNKNPERYMNMFYVTRVYYAFCMLAHTDTYGDMPFREYVRTDIPETNNVAYDTQEQIYDAMFRILEQAVDSIQPDDPQQFSVERDDICYSGDWHKWLRFANTLRLRMALRISNVNPERAKLEGQAALDNEYGLMTSNDDNMQTVPKYAPVDMGGLNDGGNENVHAMTSVLFKGESVLSYEMDSLYRHLSTGGKEYKINGGRGKPAIFKKIDPRCIKCWYRSGMTDNTLAVAQESLSKDYVGCRRGAQDPDISMQQINYSLTKTKPKPEKALDPDFWFSLSRPTVWLGYAESLFLKAEAALRGWRGADLSMSAEQYFRAGVQASMDYYMVDPTDTSAYIDGLVALNDGTFTSGDREKILEAIITQKWMAVFPNGNEGWADFRRTDYPALENQLTNMSGGSVPEGKMIKRIQYPNSENQNRYFLEHSELQAANTQGTRLWWDVADTNDASGKRLKPNNFRN
ncbi:SusD/RagB family nutrient-binding outer membrane lipoprotein [uncultured Muribaculum sp.]|uniref:SusD/RagB family nutrient-binding outer membrane lipoprotein n=1 Tax=uncultured Muribaculum sp. TaxID=1918613 RepID=UPI0026073CCE|nr:SusD/RagB family nutrient-binding outer membrane lipoprotein [uncultured Muribaculum sp.]